LGEHKRRDAVRVHLSDNWCDGVRGAALRKCQVESEMLHVILSVKHSLCRKLLGKLSVTPRNSTQYCTGGPVCYLDCESVNVGRHDDNKRRGVSR
jgi:hypothetical protein